MGYGAQMNWYLEALGKYAVFTGRARRKEFWYFNLCSLLIMVILMFIDLFTRTFSPEFGFGLLGGIYILAVFFPQLSVQVRRLHDTSRSGWWVCLAVIPVVGPLVLLFFFTQDTHVGTNEYGPNPKWPSS